MSHLNIGMLMLSIFWPGFVLAGVNWAERRKIFTKLWLAETLICAILTWAFILFLEH